VAISTFSDRQTSTSLPEWYESRSRWIAPRKVGWIVLGLWDCQTGLFSAKIWKHYNIYFPIVSNVTRVTTDHIYCEVGRWWYPTVLLQGGIVQSILCTAAILWSIVYPHLISNNFWFMHQSSQIAAETPSSETGSLQEMPLNSADIVCVLLLRYL
jgi:hypothetical protein